MATYKWEGWILSSNNHRKDGVEKMSEIDWSKAPEGATHYSPYDGIGNPFIMLDGGKWYWHTGGAWAEYIGRAGGERALARHLVGVISRPSPAWSGEGKPPVGVRCEAAIPHTSGPDGERSFIWIEGSVIAYYEIKGKTYAWFAEDDGFYPPNVLEFRPIRTPEQIAADEREAAINKMRDEIIHVVAWPSAQDARDYSAALYDAGYRKQEGK